MKLNRIFSPFILFSLGVFAGVLSGSAPAFAAPGNIPAPFEAGTSWTVCQGYNNPRVTHTASAQYALDLTGGGCDSSASGRTIISSLSGKVYYSSPFAGAVCVNTLDSRSITYVHIDSVVAAGDIVAPGQPIGSIAAPNTRSNAGLSHLHFQIYSAPNCPSDKQTPFDAAHNAHICGAPDFTSSGPDAYNNGVWSGTTFTASECAPDKAPAVIGHSAVYRFWSPTNKHHFYTASYDEMRYVYDRYDPNIWKYEGYAFYAPNNDGGTELTPVYRFWSDTFKGHFYTANETESESIIASYDSQTWKYEGVAYYAYKSQGNPLNQKPLYRFWSELYKGHFYTASQTERDYITQTYDLNTWKDEGVAYYVVPG